jgi:hypothetical protein
MSQSQSPQWANASAPASSTEVEEDNGNIMGDLMAPVSTLDEPVLETIMRDVRSVYSKLRVVLLPLDRTVRRVVAQFIQILTLCEEPWLEQLTKRIFFFCHVFIDTLWVCWYFTRRASAGNKSARGH